MLYAISIGPLVQLLLPHFQTRFDVWTKDDYLDILRETRWVTPAW